MTALTMDTIRPGPPPAVKGSSAIFAGVDQALVAAAAMIAALAVARDVSAAEFGAFSLVLLVRVLMVELGRATIGQPAQVLDAQLLRGRNRRDQSADAVSFAIGLGVVLGLIVLAASPLFGLGRPYAVVLGIGAPAIIAHDAVRHVLFAAGSIRRAAALDACVLVIQVSVSIVASANGWSPVWHFIGWAGGTAVAAIVGMWRAGLAPSVGGSRRWRHQAAEFWPGLLADTGLVQIQRQVSTWLMLGFGSLTAVAGFRGAQTGFRPLGVATGGVRMMLLPALASDEEQTGPKDAGSNRALIASILLGVTAAAITAALIALPDTVGEELLGATWAATSSFILPVGITQTAQALAVGAQLSLTSRRQTDRLARIRSGTVTLHVAGLLIGGAYEGAVGAAWALALTNVMALAIWWSVASRHPARDRSDAISPTTTLEELA